MKTVNLILFIICILNPDCELQASIVTGTSMPTTVETAIKRAAEEGKLVFVDFHAPWCTPCQWMEKNTYTNQSVNQLLHQNYVSVKIDIDQEDGFRLKNVFDIKYLPTILIFNSDGKLTDRIEETLSPSKLADILAKHNTPVNKTVIRHELNKAPSLTYTDDYISESMQNQAEEYKKQFFTKQTNKVFRVQVGVFSSYQQAERTVKMLTEQNDNPISVVTEYKEGRPYFKVRIGQFETYEAAEEYKSKLLTDQKIEAVIN